MAALIQHLDLIAGHRHRRAADLDRQFAQTQRVGGNRPAGFGLPPMVDHRNFQGVLRPHDGIGVGALTGQIQRLEVGKVVIGHQLCLRIVAFDRAQGGGSGKETADLVFGDHPPEGAGIGGADGFALEHDRCATGDQRTIADVRMPDDPADVGCRPEDIARADVVHGFHRPVQRHQVTASGAYDTLGRAGGARSVEDIGGVVARYRHAFGRLYAVLEAMPVEVAAFNQFGNLLFALKYNAKIGFVRGHVKRAVQQRFVMDDAVGLDPARGGDDRFGLAVVNAHRQFIGGKTAEHHGMHGTETGAGEHGLQRLWHHRHVDQHAVALCHPFGPQRTGKQGHPVAQVDIGDAAGDAGDRAVMDDRHLITASGLDMAVDGVPTGVDHAGAEPFIKRRAGVIEGAGRWRYPVDFFGSLHPESFRIGFPACVDFCVCHCIPPPVLPFISFAPLV